MKIDPYKHKEKYLKWKEQVVNGIPDLSTANSDIIKKFLFEMENGINVANGSKKGARSFIRLNSLKDRLTFLAKQFKTRFDVDNILEVKEEQLFSFFTGMRTGEIKKRDGTEYKSVADYVKIFKSFWHWHMKVSRKLRKEDVFDITLDLDTRREKPKWVYLTFDDIKKLINEAKFEYKVLILFLFESGVRSPTELVNIRFIDLEWSEKDKMYFLNIRTETSKTKGRRINLIYTSELLKDYIAKQNFKETDYLFPIKEVSVNKYLKRLSQKVFGDKESQAGEIYSKLTMYDFRHCCTCHMLNTGKDFTTIMYRMGWTRPDEIFYYSEFLGLKDTTNHENILTDITKTEIEKDLIKVKQENLTLQEELRIMKEQMKLIQEQTNQVYEKLVKGN